MIAFVEKRKIQRPNWNEYLAHSSEPAIEQSDIFYSQVIILDLLLEAGHISSHWKLGFKGSSI